MEVASAVQDSTPARLAALMEKAMSAKSRREMVVERFAKVNSQGGGSAADWEHTHANFGYGKTHCYNVVSALHCAEVDSRL
jgi:hypothetical protein